MPKITIDKQKISTEWDIRIEIFQETASIDEIMIDRPFSKNWIFGISVVNTEPENQISFKDMLSRLSRIGKSQ